MVMHVEAPAKLNRFLAVLGRRDDGFHELELVTTVLEGMRDLTDVLEAEPASSLSLELHGPAAQGLQADEDNLVIRAWRLLERETGRALPARLRLEKRIPAGGGLGGGSSDGASALRLGNAMHGLGLPGSVLLRLGAELGSDVPLFLLGGTVLGLGRGERVLPLAPIALEPMLIVHPGLHVPTPKVYAALRETGYPTPSPCPALMPGEAPPWRNDLTAASLRVCPELDGVRQALIQVGGDPILCGSGSCWAARFPSAKEAHNGMNRLQSARPDWSIWLV